MTKEEIADIYAGRYVDGMWSYTQALYEAKKCGVSKEEFDAEVFAWRVALGKVKRTSVDKENRWEKSV